ncbi:MAG TPA: hypothetical protein PLD73_03660 [Candidatus Hydrogenedentes bacterium]|jgi:hypothetical protein|nr:hypothetical protein [Candidatus Hydrogenedentota bacterium]
MKRRTFLGTAAASFATVGAAQGQTSSQPGGKAATMLAGFAREDITPSLGTTMMGFGTRDMEHGCTGVHDPIYTRALYLEHGGEAALIMGYDMCFLGREDADRFKGAVGRVMDLLPRQIFLNTSHNHVGPKAGTWYSAGYEAPDRDYLNQLEQATVKAALAARAQARPVNMRAGVTTSELPVNRRRRMPDGSIQNRPNPGGPTYNKLPIVLFEDPSGEVVCLLFSISCHPSMVSGWEISAEYPGAAMDRLDAHFGAPCSLFLQGVGGDAKPLVIGRDTESWIPGTWELMGEAGAIVAGEVLDAVGKGLAPVAPALASASEEMRWALEPAPGREFFEDIAANAPEEGRARDVKFMWARKTLEDLERGLPLPTDVPLLLHGIQLGDQLRIIGIEGEALHGWGYFIEDFYGKKGVTIPLGYTDGQGMYLPLTEQLPEGGYEVISYWEYGYPSSLAPGMEEKVREALAALQNRGIS